MLQMEEYDSDVDVSFSLQAVWIMKMMKYLRTLCFKLINHHYVFNFSFCQKIIKKVFIFTIFDHLAEIWPFSDL